MTPPRRIIILGGGIAGLTAAYRLSSLLPSSKITLLETTDRLGGWVRSVPYRVTSLDELGRASTKDVVLDSGPRTLRPRGSKGAMSTLRLANLGLESSIIPIPKSHPSAKSRFILDPNTYTLTKLPSGISDFFKLQPPLLRGLLKSLLLEPFASLRRIPNINSKPHYEHSVMSKQTERGKDETVDSFISRRFGKPMTLLVSSMIHGIYATSSSVLSVRSSPFAYAWKTERKYGSIIPYIFLPRHDPSVPTLDMKEDDYMNDLKKQSSDWSLYGLKGGLESLTSKLISQLVQSKNVDIHLSSKVTSIEISSLDPSFTSEPSSYPIPSNKKPTTNSDSVSTGNYSHSDPSNLSNNVKVYTSQNTFIADCIISTLPPSTLSHLLPLSQLGVNPSTTVGVINLLYPLDPKHVHPEGFGYLIPKSTRRQNLEGVLGVIFDSTALPGVDSSEGFTKLTVMIGGPYWSNFDPSYNPSLISQTPNSGRSNGRIEDQKEIFKIPKEEELSELALKHLHRVFPNLERTKPLLNISHLHKDCIPTYLPGHGDRLRKTHEDILSKNWGGRLILAGNGYGGVGVNDSVWSAECAVKGVMEWRQITGLEDWAKWE
ncbi:protoporphyrinogen oxidase [Tremella mesenterica]|uniref:Protoporphyrinogen oxidase n=1 Tax=Tremella mesenterica TaxID=5217 RepID=A0A4Q1BS99_TREME|nr:protoporphyrinogen oxidase [Tremella mesenterica]